MAAKAQDNPALQSFREFVKEQAAQRNLSMRKLSQAIGMTPSHLSEVLSGKKKINVNFLNALADYLQISRVDVYREAGWIDPDESEEMLGLGQVKKWYVRDPNFRQAVNSMMAMDEGQRTEIFEWIITKALSGNDHVQTPSLMEDVVKGGQLQPDALKKLTPKEQKALTSALQVITETFLSLSEEKDENNSLNVDE